MNYESIVIQSLADLPNFTGVNTLILDTETSGLSPYHGDRICGIAISPFHSNKNFYIPIRHAEQPAGVYNGPDLENLPPENVFNWLRNYTQDPQKTWILHNAKYDINMFRFENITLEGPLFDTMVLAHVFDGSLYQYALDVLSKLYLQFRHDRLKVLESWIENVLPRGKTEEGVIDANYSLLPIHIVGEYGNEDLQVTRELMQYLNKQPQYDAPYNYGNPAQGTRELIQNEMKLVKVLADMEFRGVRVDLALAADLRDTALDEMSRIQEKLARLAGFSFSPLAWGQRDEALTKAGGEILFWNLPEEERGKQKKQKYTRDKTLSTGRACWNASAVLEYLMEFRNSGNTKAYDFILTYHEYTSRAYIVSNYLEAYLRGADQHSRVHGQINQTGTLTGRLSASKPNLQNVAKTKGTADQHDFEKFLGTKDETALNRRIRSIMVATPGCAFVSEDYKQIEYRIAAYLSNDPDLIEQYRVNPELDYHQMTADGAGIDRDRAKTVNFGILYGMGLQSLADSLKILKDQAKALQNQIFDSRPSLRALIRELSLEASRNGFVQNACGRICKVTDGLEYVALNYKDQGFAGDLMRNALVNIHTLIRREKLPVEMLLTVHDEINYDIPIPLVRELAPLLAQEMCRSPFMPTIPILCDIEVGPSWGNLDPFTEWCTNFEKSS